MQSLLPASEAFTTARHQAVYDAITRLHADIGRVDVVILADMLEDEKDITDFLFELAQKCQSPAHVGYYARIVRARWDLRRLVEACGAVVHDAYTTTDVVGDMAGGIIAKAEERIATIAGDRPSANRPQSIADIAGPVAQAVIDPMTIRNGDWSTIVVMARWMALSLLPNEGLEATWPAFRVSSGRSSPHTNSCSSCRSCMM